jgi:hypothetical protein
MSRSASVEAVDEGVGQLDERLGQLPLTHLRSPSSTMVLDARGQRVRAQSAGAGFAQRHS